MHNPQTFIGTHVLAESLRLAKVRLGLLYAAQLFRAEG